MLEKLLKRKRRHNKIRQTVRGTMKRPRIVVFKSNIKTYVQVINDDEGTVLIASDTTKITDKNKKPIEKCKLLGIKIAEELKNMKIETIVFDRNGYKYHGKVRELADGIREGGIKF